MRMASARVLVASIVMSVGFAAIAPKAVASQGTCTSTIFVDSNVAPNNSVVGVFYYSYSPYYVSFGLIQNVNYPTTPYSSDWTDYGGTYIIEGSRNDSGSTSTMVGNLNATVYC